MADTDTSTPCIEVTQPLMSLDQARRLENAAYMQWWHSPSKAQQLARSFSFKTG